MSLYCGMAYIAGPRLESFDFGPGSLVSFVSRYGGPTAIAPHFHPRLELVLFRGVRGELRLPGRAEPIVDGRIYLVGCDAVHAYRLEPEAADHAAFVLIVDLEACAAPLASYGAACRAAFLDRFSRPDATFTDDSGASQALIRLARRKLGPSRGAELRALGELSDLYGLLAVLGAAIPERTSPDEPQSDRTDSSLHETARRVIAVIREGAGGPLSLDGIARRCAVSKHHLCRRFKEATGYTIGDYLTETRLERSCAVLAAGGRVTEACAEAGFRSLSHFVQAFKERYGTTPGRWAGGAAPR